MQIALGECILFHLIDFNFQFLYSCFIWYGDCTIYRSCYTNKNRLCRLTAAIVMFLLQFIHLREYFGSDIWEVLMTFYDFFIKVLHLRHLVWVLSSCCLTSVIVVFFQGVYRYGFRKSIIWLTFFISFQGDMFLTWDSLSKDEMVDWTLGNESRSISLEAGSAIFSVTVSAFWNKMY